jgi:hypothetical protein
VRHSENGLRSGKPAFKRSGKNALKEYRNSISPLFIAGNLKGIFGDWQGAVFRYFQRLGGFDMQVALRKRKLDPIGMKAVPNRQKNRVLNAANPILGIIDPNSQ